jgi:hypothetical protein
MKRWTAVAWTTFLVATACSTPATGPIALDDLAATTPSTPIDIDVLLNDRAPAGGRLRIVSVREGAGTVEIVDTRVVYVPPTDLTVDSFTYTVEDDEGRTASASVTVTVEDVVPDDATTRDEPPDASTVPSTPITTVPPPTTTTVPTTTTTTTVLPATTTTTVPPPAATTTTVTPPPLPPLPPEPARFDPTVVDFGEIAVGSRDRRLVAVTAGDDPFEVGRADPATNRGVGFNEDRRCGLLQPGETCEATLTFAPVEADPAFDITVFPGRTPSLRVTAVVSQPPIPAPQWVEPRDGSELGFGRLLDGLPVVLEPAPEHRELILHADVCVDQTRCTRAGFSVVGRSPVQIDLVVFDHATLRLIRDELADGADVRIRLSAEGVTVDGRSDPADATVEVAVVQYVASREADIARHRDSRGDVATRLDHVHRRHSAERHPDDLGVPTGPGPALRQLAESLGDVVPREPPDVDRPTPAPMRLAAHR